MRVSFWQRLFADPNGAPALVRRLLIERRQKSGLTQQQVADRLGWGQKTVSKIERGSKRVTAVELIELAEALGFSAMAAIRRVANAKRREMENPAPLRPPQVCFREEGRPNQVQRVTRLPANCGGRALRRPYRGRKLPTAVQPCFHASPSLGAAPGMG